MAPEARPKRIVLKPAFFAVFSFVLYKRIGLKPRIFCFFYFLLHVFSCKKGVFAFFFLLHAFSCKSIVFFTSFLAMVRCA